MSIHPRVLLSTTLAGLALACVQTLPGADDEVGDTGSESATGDSGTDSTTTSSTETTDATETGPMLCTGPQDCMDAAMPFCNMDGACVACDGMPEPDVACAGADAELPVCDDARCVECDGGKTAACEGETPLCDYATNSCVGCTEHAQCESACDIGAGSCFHLSVHVDGDAAVNLATCLAADGGPSNPYCSIADALNGRLSSKQIEIVLHEKSNDGVYYESILIPEKSIAVFGASGERPRLASMTAFHVTKFANFYLRGVDIVSGANGLVVDGKAWVEATLIDTNGVGVTVNGGQTWIDESLITANAAQGVSLNGGTAVIERSRIVNNTGGGIVVDGGGMLMLENSFVGGNVNDVAAVDVVDGDAEISYSTLAAGAKILVDPTALSCTLGSGVTVRNSILVSPAVEPAVACNGASIESSVLEDTTDFPDNTEATFSANWFTAYANGDFHLSAMHPAAIDTAALWQSGDPATDIDGNARPTTDGTNDFAGADRIP